VGGTAVGVVGGGVDVGRRVIVAVAVGVGVSVGAAVGVSVGVADGGNTTANLPSGDEGLVGARSALNSARLPPRGAQPRPSASSRASNTAAMPMTNQAGLVMGVCSTPLRRLRR
jgi:hypothetical protein